MIDPTKQYKTRDGLEVVIHTTTMGGEYPIHGAYKDVEGWDVEGWEVASWTNEGDFQRGYRSKFDLVEVPQIVERWVLFHIASKTVGVQLYTTYDAAFSSAGSDQSIVKVEIQV
tara:strand:- start:448 stop:789 length:342 start_codon:yes stop_codon:yes gene_type:complete